MSRDIGMKPIANPSRDRSWDKYARSTVTTDDIVLAVSMVMDECRAICLRMIEDSGFAVWNKSTDIGKEAVTEIDIAIDRLLCTRLPILLPGIVCISEEGCRSIPVPALEGLVAVIDPIDGTKSVASEGNEYAISVAVVESAKPLTSVIDFPGTRDRLLSVAGVGTWLNGEDVTLPHAMDVPNRLAVSPRAVDDPMVALISSDLANLAAYPITAFCPKALALLSGRVKAAVFMPDPTHPYAVWDVLGAAIALESAGGVVVDWEGRSIVVKAIASLHSRRFYDFDGWCAGDAATVERLLDKRGKVETTYHG